MILYTPLSEHDIFPDEEQEFESHKWYSYQGKMLKLKDLSDGSYEIVQMASTNPNDYLDQQLCPGNKIRLF
ncbi:hypothetical protein HNQ94_001311 [Salirhabdus euzebyi]|uniref:YlzJ-like protein n=1 Tax=Salirhabdus euzebyi TaxID=394506 RepID=A0A841Q3A8_9BACI|nr:YlzJ-like family protein [Salirhabdus euzebyi]MBB6452865.1 hypothetical protein [Salirhabdus euzebyi]